MPKKIIKKICFRIGFVVLVLGLLSLGVSSTIVLATFWGGQPHVPQTMSHNMIEFSEVRTGYYTELGRDETDQYQIELSEGEQINLFLIIPDKTLASVRVPVLEVADLEYHENSAGEWKNSSSFDRWIISQQASFEAPEVGVYDLVVYDTVGEPGEYALVFSGNDPVHPIDLARLVIGTIRINL